MKTHASVKWLHCRNVLRIVETKKTSLLDLDGTAEKISLGGLGGGMLLAGTLALAGWRKRKQSEA